MEEDRNALKILTGKPTGNISFGRLMRRWKDNIRKDFKEICNRRKWDDLAQDRDSWRVLVNVALNLRVP